MSIRDRIPGVAGATAGRRGRLVRSSVGALALLAFVAGACGSDGDSTAPVAPDPLATTIPVAETAPGAAPTGGDPALGPDVVRVVGTVRDGTLVGSIDGEVPLPLHLDVAAPGGGNGAIVNRADVAGASSTLVWDGGRPVTLSGDRSITVPSGTFVIGTGIRLALGDTAIALPAGSYRLDGPHAVGDAAGLASPSDGTAFTTTDGASLSGTGTVEAALAPNQTYLFLGPGRVELTGEFTVQTDLDAVTTTSVEQATGSYEVTLTFSDGGTVVAVEILLGGDVTVG